MLDLKRVLFYRLRLITLASAILALTGCLPGSYGEQSRSRAKSLAEEARNHQLGGHADKALGAYLNAINADPGYARAHFDYAVLLQDDFSDYVGAIYHYRRYLDLKPDTEKREMIKERIRVALQSLIGKLSGRGNGAGEDMNEVMREYAQLRKENERLKNEIAELQARLKHLNEKEFDVSGADRSTGASSSITGDGSVPGDRLYRVVPGDNLTRIAIKMYSDPDESHRIFEANRDRLDGPNDLKAGQVLVIPRR